MMYFFWIMLIQELSTEIKYWLLKMRSGTGVFTVFQQEY